MKTRKKVNATKKTKKVNERAYVSIEYFSDAKSDEDVKRNQKEINFAKKILKSKKIFITEFAYDEYTVFSTIELNADKAYKIAHDYCTDEYNILFYENVKNGLDIQYID